MQNFKSSIFRLGAACGIVTLILCSAQAADIQGPFGEPGHGPMDRAPSEMGPGPQGAEGPHGGEGPHGAEGPQGGEGPHAMPAFLHGIVLSEAQQDKLFQIHYALEPQLRELHKTLQKTHDALRKLPLSSPFDDAKAKSLADAAARAESELTLLHVRSEAKIYALLTPEQRKTVDEHKAGHGPHPVPPAAPAKPVQH